MCIHAGRACGETVLLSPVLCTGCSFTYFKYSSCNTLDNLLFATTYAQTTQSYAVSCAQTAQSCAVACAQTAQSCAVACAQTNWAQCCETTHNYRNTTHNTDTNPNTNSLYVPSVVANTKASHWRSPWSNSVHFSSLQQIYLTSLSMLLPNISSFSKWLFSKRSPYQNYDFISPFPSPYIYSQHSDHYLI
jgi:hypothetical protein